MTKTDRVIVLDIDGNRLAVFPGYDCPTKAQLQRDYPTFQKAQIFNRRGELKGLL